MTMGIILPILQVVHTIPATGECWRAIIIYKVSIESDSVRLDQYRSIMIYPTVIAIPKRCFRKKKTEAVLLHHAQGIYVRSISYLTSICNPKLRQLSTRFLISDHKLLIEKGHHSRPNTPVTERKYTLCRAVGAYLAGPASAGPIFCEPL